jgi:hypothetical protein
MIEPRCLEPLSALVEMHQRYRPVLFQVPT